MKRLTFFLFTICTILLSSCSTTRAPSINMLEKRADYNGEIDIDTFLEGQPSLLVPSRTKPTEIDIYIHPHETIYGDYFRGGYVRSIVAQSKWELRNKKMPKAYSTRKKKVESKVSKKRINKKRKSLKSQGNFQIRGNH